MIEKDKFVMSSCETLEQFSKKNFSISYRGKSESASLNGALSKLISGPNHCHFLSNSHELLSRQYTYYHYQRSSTIFLKYKQKKMVLLQVMIKFVLSPQN